MKNTASELMRKYVNSQKFSSTTEIMEAMKNMYGLARAGRRYSAIRRTCSVDTPNVSAPAPPHVCGGSPQSRDGYYGTYDCSMHFIKTSALQALILSAIREVSSFVRSDEKEFLHLVREETNAEIEIAAKEQKKQLHRAEKRIAELDGLIKKLYEGNATGKIPNKHFNRMLAEYDKEQSSLEQEFSELQQAIFTQKQDYENPQRFIALVKRHTDFTELTTPMLNEFIEKVIVHEATGDRAHRKQKVDIYFNFIGNFVPPKQEPVAPILTAEQQEIERKKEMRRDREREQNRLRMQRVRAAQKAALQADGMEKGAILVSSLPHLEPQRAANV